MKIDNLAISAISANDPIDRIELPLVFEEFGGNAKLKIDGKAAPYYRELRMLW